MDPKQLLNKIIERKDLSTKEAAFLLEEIIRGHLNASQIAAVLVALRTKGEAVDEITGFVQTMRMHMVTIAPRGSAIDIVGTGGDGSNTFNISTAASFVVAGTGVKVAKHGNRATSSTCGSADVLEALGVNLALTPAQAEVVLEKVGMVFLFAPLYHPAMKVIGPIRKELGIRTFFNFLGPFLNPAGVRRALIGVPNVTIAKTMAKVATRLGYDRLLLVSSADGMDEISTIGKTYLFDIQKQRVTKQTVSPGKFGLKKAGKKALQGGDAAQNAAIIINILSGRKGPAREVVVLNGAFAMVVSGKAKSVKEGIHLAKESIDSGSAKQVLEKLIEESRRYG